jgi:hypothetical protein
VTLAATSRLTRQAARLMRFDEMPFTEEFDGIWACASLRHVSRADTLRVWPNFIRALKTRGVWYLSFKVGTNEEFRNGRLFNDHTESSLVATIDSFPGLTIIEIWQFADVVHHGQNRSGLMPFSDVFQDFLHRRWLSIDEPRAATYRRIGAVRALSKHVVCVKFEVFHKRFCPRLFWLSDSLTFEFVVLSPILKLLFDTFADHNSLVGGPTVRYPWSNKV